MKEVTKDVWLDSIGEKHPAYSHWVSCTDECVFYRGDLCLFSFRVLDKEYYDFHVHFPDGKVRLNRSDFRKLKSLVRERGGAMMFAYADGSDFIRRLAKVYKWRYDSANRIYYYSLEG